MKVDMSLNKETKQIKRYVKSSIRTGRIRKMGKTKILNIDIPIHFLSTILSLEAKDHYSHIDLFFFFFFFTFSYVYNYRSGKSNYQKAMRSDHGINVNRHYQFS